MAHHRAGRWRAAREAFGQIVRQWPEDVQAIHLLALSTWRDGQAIEAEALVRQALALAPQQARLLLSHAQILCDLKQLPAARQSCERAVAIDPKLIAGWTTLSEICTEARDDEAAIKAATEATKLTPTDAAVWGNLSNACLSAGQSDEAQAALDRARALNPQLPGLDSNQATLFASQGKDADAEVFFRKQLTRDPKLSQAHAGLALALLRQGKWGEGWREFAWRHRTTSNDPPIWNGEAIRSLQVNWEQGYGDTIMLSRFLPALAKRIEQVIVRVQPDLVPLLTPAFPEVTILPHGQAHERCDRQVDLMDVPARVCPNPRDYAGAFPYLVLDVAFIARWRERVSALPGRRVGLVWAGNPKHRRDRERSCSLPLLRPLIQCKGVSFLSLQKGPAAEQVQAALDFPITNWSADLTAFTETAALIMNLDLVIAVDTAVAHLAGALNRPVWTMLSHVPDWRWQSTGETTAWYPSMRLFRQNPSNDWNELANRVAVALDQWANFSA